MQGLLGEVVALWLWIQERVLLIVLRAWLGRERFEQWAQAKKQVEYYFSDTNFATDKFLQDACAKGDSYLEISELVKFRKMQALKADAAMVVSVASWSSVVVLDSSKTKIKRRYPLSKWKNRSFMTESVVYAKTFPTEDVSRAEIEAFLDEHLAPLKLKAADRVKLLYSGNDFSGSITIQFDSPEDAELVILHFAENPPIWSTTFTNPILFESWAHHKKGPKKKALPSDGESPNGSPKASPDKRLAPGELSEEQAKILNEFRQQYNLLKLETTTIEESPTRFRYSVSLEYQGHKYVGTGPRLTKKKSALRAAEYDLCRQLARVVAPTDLKYRNFFETPLNKSSELYSSSSNLASSEVVNHDERVARQQDEARVKRLLHWVDEQTLEDIITSKESNNGKNSSGSSSLLELVGLRLGGPDARAFSEIIKKRGWTDLIRDFEKHIEENAQKDNEEFLTKVIEVPEEEEDPVAALSPSEDDLLLMGTIGDVDFISQAPVDATSVDIGFWHSENEFVPLWRTGNSTRIDFNKNAYVLAFGFNRHSVAYKFKNLVREISEPMRIEGKLDGGADDELSFVLNLRRAPKLLHKPPNRQLWARSLDFTPNDAWNRATHMRIHFEGEQFQKQIAPLLWVSSSLVQVGMMKLNFFAGGYKNITLPDLESVILPPKLDELAFDVRFKIQCLVSKNILTKYDISGELVDLIATLPVKKACSVLQSIESHGKRCFHPIKSIKKALSSYHHVDILTEEEESSKSQHYVMVPHVTVTPLRIWCDGPVAEISNRVLRAFDNHKNRFIRVAFKEEDGKTSIRGVGRAAIRDRIMKFLESGFGLDIVNLKYSWLVFSSGQLRGHKTWFFSETSDLTCNQIRSWMGNFDHIFNIALYSSRLGQALSSTFPTIEINMQTEVENVPDVKRNGYNFSDGVGTVSSSLAAEIASKLPLKKGSRVPSAFQIRFGGIKGVICVDPRIAEKRLVRIRPSMDKFPSKHTNMEVISWAKPTPAHLNRQLILILSDLGVKDEVFLHAQETALQKISAISSAGSKVQDESANQVEIDLLESTWRVKNKPDSLPGRAVRMLRSGFQMHTEPYLNNVLKVLNLRRFQDLRVMARIPVDDGIYVLGIMDEYELLEYGQIFLQRSVGSETVVVTGKVVVSRSPALHPGDVRVLEAVDIPELHHFVDCIVFPQKGPRPHPHECSGGDLDGDTYLVLWGDRWIPTKQDTPPFDAHETVSSVVATGSGKDDNLVCLNEVRQFFIDYIYDDKLGNIADAHMYHADKSPLGVFDPICLELAKWHNVAVDAPKTGKQVPALECMKIPEYPDHGCPTTLTRTYPSTKVLGKLFRMADAQVALAKSLLVSDNSVVTSVDPDLVLEGYEHFLSESIVFRDAYSIELFNLMRQYEMHDQFQMVSGDAFWENKAQRREWEGLRDGVEKCIQSLRDKFRAAFANSGPHDTALLRASAWYVATYDPRFRPEEGTEIPVSVTFPWLLDDLLCDIKLSAKEKRKAIIEESQ